MQSHILDTGILLDTVHCKKKFTDFPVPSQPNSLWPGRKNQPFDSERTLVLTGYLNLPTVYRYRITNTFLCRYLPVPYKPEIIRYRILLEIKIEDKEIIYN
jgi:hypothetical protein